jgi:hypothetical protein
MNVPIQPYTSGTDWRLPRHNLIANNASSSNGFLFFDSWTFTPGTNFQSFNTKNHLDYSCLDSSNVKIGNSNNTNYSSDFSNTNQSLSLNKSVTSWDTMINYGSPVDGYRSGYQNLEIVEGGSVIMANSTSTPARSNYRYFSPTYFTQYPTDTLPMTSSSKIVMRAERLPSSDVRDRRFVLHQNGAFAMYQLSDGGESSLLVPTYTTGTETNGDLSDDFAEDGGNVAQTVLATFNCETMVPLKCYQGSGTNISVNTNNCEVPSDRMIQGCYCLLNKDYIAEYPEDARLFLEWKTRFTITFAACRGVFAQTFQNNWINGVLYMFSFNKSTTYSLTEPDEPQYNYCKDTIIFNQLNYTVNKLYFIKI